MWRVRSGLTDADLGGGVVKQRIAHKGGDRSGGLRTIVLFRRGELAVFVSDSSSRRRSFRRRDATAVRYWAEDMGAAPFE